MNLGSIPRSTFYARKEGRAAPLASPPARRGPKTKITDAELLGMPWVLTTSARSLAAGGVEVMERATGNRRIEPIDGVAACPSDCTR